MTNTRESIHTERGLSLNPSKGHTGFPTPFDVAFMEDAHAELNSAVISTTPFEESGRLDAVLDMRTLLNGLFERAAYRSAESWGDNVRFVNALVTGLGTGVIRMECADDINVLRLLISKRPAAQIVEYYVHTGEYARFAETSRRGDGTFPSLREDYEDFDSTKEIRERMYRLYCYDVNKVREHIESGVNPSEHMSLPLEIRMEFSGFWNEVTTYRHPILDHQHLFDDTVFEIMKTMEAMST